MHVLIVCNNSNSLALEAVGVLERFLDSECIDYTTVNADTMWRLPAMPFQGNGKVVMNLAPDGSKVLSDSVTLVVALGGDGTILRAARQVGDSGVPIIGINYGHLGFLANSSDDGVVNIVNAALKGHVKEQERTNLHISVECRETESVELITHDDDGPINEHYGSASFFALNEMAVTRGTLGRIIDFSVSIDDEFLSEQRGDGVVIASATGSTAYALSAGGPIMAPSYAGLVFVPVAPHSLRSRAVVTAPGEAIDLDFPANRATRAATMFLDGQIVPFEKPISHITVQPGKMPTRLLMYKNENFYRFASQTFF